MTSGNESVTTIPPSEGRRQFAVMHLPLPRDGEKQKGAVCVYEKTKQARGLGLCWQKSYRRIIFGLALTLTTREQSFFCLTYKRSK